MKELGKIQDEERSLCYKEVIICSAIQIMDALDQCVDLAPRKEKIQQLLLELLHVAKITHGNVTDMEEALRIAAVRLSNAMLNYEARARGVNG